MSDLEDYDPDKPIPFMVAPEGDAALWASAIRKWRDQETEPHSVSWRSATIVADAVALGNISPERAA